MLLLTLFLLYLRQKSCSFVCSTPLVWFSFSNCLAERSSFPTLLVWSPERGHFCGTHLAPRVLTPTLGPVHLCFLFYPEHITYPLNQNPPHRDHFQQHLSCFNVSSHYSPQTLPFLNLVPSCLLSQTLVICLPSIPNMPQASSLYLLL